MEGHSEWLSMGPAVRFLQVAAGLGLVLVLRCAYVVLWMRSAWGRAARDLPAGGKVATVIVLGSGGHTTEMLELSMRMDPERYSPRVYAVAATDTHSAGAVRAAEAARQRTDHAVARIPRSREVGQSWTSTVASTARACLYCLVLVFRTQPELVLINGPGTCLPVLWSHFFWRAVGVLPLRSRAVFVETVARVKKPSLTGRLARPLVDLYFVQWEDLLGGAAIHTRGLLL